MGIDAKIYDLTEKDDLITCNLRSLDSKVLTETFPALWMEVDAPATAPANFPATAPAAAPAAAPATAPAIAPKAGVPATYQEQIPVGRCRVDPGHRGWSIVAARRESPGDV